MVKGAIALANALADKRSVKLISLKKADHWSFSLDERVKLVSFGSKSWGHKVRAYRDLLEDSGGRAGSVSISLCFSADLVNLYCKKNAFIVSSLRANNFVNYRLDYGLIGLIIAYFHLSLMKFFDTVWVLSKAMSKQLEQVTSISPFIAGNFIDEKSIEKYRDFYSRNERFKFVFVGSLTERKQPLLLVRAIHSLHLEGFNVCLDLIGSGPLKQKIRDYIVINKLESHVNIIGQVDSPYCYIARADAFVLPSISEGISRAAMEALYLGIPCILRDVDGNRELIFSGKNGELFKDDNSLLLIMKNFVHENKRNTENLLPSGFRQHTECNKILSQIESVISVV